MKTEQEARKVLAALEPSILGEELKLLPLALVGAIVHEDSILLWGDKRIWMFELSRDLIAALKPIRTLQALRGESPNRKLAVTASQAGFVSHPEGISGLTFYVPQRWLSDTMKMPIFLPMCLSTRDSIVSLSKEGNHLCLKTRTGPYFVAQVPASSNGGSA